MDGIVNINLLPHKRTKRNIVLIFSLTLIAVSSALLFYPFIGQFEYFFRTAPAQTPEIFTVLPDFEEPTRADEGIYEAKVSSENVLVREVPQEPLVVSGVAEPVQKAVLPVQQVMQTQTAVPAPVARRENTLIIPSINVEMPLVEGTTEKALLSGAWRIPGTSSPLLGGNTVIAGHRWLYKPPSRRTFYNLDKVLIGDMVNIIWEGKDYSYRVRDIRVVEPGEVQILASTNDNIVTLFTCTPLFSTSHRLVVIAEKI